MKGVIAMCLAEAVEQQFGRAKWESVLTEAGLPPRRTFMAVEETADQDVLRLIESTCKVLNVSLEDAAALFGEHWCVSFAPRIYKAYYRRAQTAKEFLVQMKQIHEEVTANIPNAKPPAFDCIDAGPNKLRMRYASARNLQEIWIGCVKGVGKAFKESLAIERIGLSEIEVTFG